MKLSPNVTNIPQMARAAEEGGADAISLVNTFGAMAIDPETRRRVSPTSPPDSPAPPSSPSPCAWSTRPRTPSSIPVIGMGGITTAKDVVEFMLAGAAAVEVGTANFWDPCATEKIVEGLEGWCLEHRVQKHPRADRRADHALKTP